MRRWFYANRDQWCGGGGPGCVQRIKEGAPMLVITITNLRRQLVRCQICAGEPVDHAACDAAAASAAATREETAHKVREFVRAGAIGQQMFGDTPDGE